MGKKLSRSSLVSGLLPSGLVLSGLLLGATLAVTAPTAQAQVPSRARRGAQMTNLLYVWNSTIPGDERETKRLLRYARRRGFNALALEASPVGYGVQGALDRYDDFVEDAHAAGLEVHALIGYSWFTVPDNAGLPGQPTGQGEGWSLVQGIVGANLFDGIVDDSQPHTVVFWDDAGVAHNWFWEDVPYATQSYLDWLGGVKMYAGDLPVIAATPSWYDVDSRLTSLFLNGNASPRDFASYVADEADVVNVLAYRDEAQGPGGIIASAAGEMQYGPVIVGVETADLGPALEGQTFWEEGQRALRRALRKTYRAFRSEEHMGGFSVHYYGSLRLLGRNGPRQ